MTVGPRIADEARPSFVETLAFRVAVATFGSSLAASTLLIPLVAIQAGLSAAIIGLLAGTSAVAQFSLRLALPWFLARYTDRNLLGIASLLIAGSYILLVVSQAPWVFFLAQLSQGSARALFWTSSQTHAVRGPGGSVGNLARIQAIANLGSVTGPAIAGFMSGITPELALGVAAALGAVGSVCSRAMRQLPPFVRPPREARRGVWRRPGVDLACWASFAAGGWRAMQGSYVPVALTNAGIVPGVAGVLLSLSDVMGTAAVFSMIRFTPRSNRWAIGLSVVGIAVGLALVPYVAGTVPLVAAAIAVAGAGSGFLMTLGPAVASDSVDAEERGDALALAGTFRAGALLGTPTGVAAGLSLVTLPVAMMVAAGALALPALFTDLRPRPALAAGKR